MLAVSSTNMWKVVIHRYSCFIVYLKKNTVNILYLKKNTVSIVYLKKNTVSISNLHHLNYDFYLFSYLVLTDR